MTREEALKILDTIPTQSEQVDALEMAIKALEQIQEWTPVSEPPKESGDYLVTLKITENVSCVDKLSYSLDLYSVDKYDFAGEKRPGWYDFSSEWGYYEVNNVVAWMPSPEAYKAESEEV